jgi:HEAT repeat protein
MMPFDGEVRSILLWCSIVMSSAVGAGCLQEAPAPSVEHGVRLVVGLLQDENPDVRRTAAESLGKIGDPSSIRVILPLLKDPTPAVRAAATQALGRLAASDDAAVIAGLVEALQDPSDKVKQAAAVAFGDIEPPPSRLESLASLLGSADAAVRRAAVRALLLVDTGPFAGRLLPLLEDRDAEVRQSAVAALGVSGDPRAATALGARLAKDPSAGVRAEAVYHLGKSSGSELRALLQRAGEQEADPGVRRWIEAELRALRVND